MKATERIGRYRLDRRLGAGAFGVVWLAHDDVLEAPVAVKVMADNWSHRLDIRERFLSEARLLRRADSSRVVQVFDIGETPDERPYFVMEYADGGTLEDRLADGPLPLPVALRLTARTARGAAALHAAGIVHRDIKPSNVLFRSSTDGEDEDGDRVLLADLGLAKSLAQASGLTMAAGSAGYQPPEQAEPGAGIDARADVYSLGALGYHLVTGSVPGPPGKVVPPSELRPGLHPDIERALMRAMEPERERRWPTAKDFADALERLAAEAADTGEPAGEPARPAESGPPTQPASSGASEPPTEPVAPRPGRFRRKALLVAAAVVVLAGGGTAAWLLGQSSGDDGDGGGAVRVADTTGQITAEVPREWAGQLRDSGWSPQTLGLGAESAPGLAVADDLTGWLDLGAAVNGLFVGLSERGDVAAQVSELTHDSCRFAGSRDYEGADWQGTVHTWEECEGGSGTFTEAALAPADGSDQPQLFVQIRQHGGGDATDRILDGLRVER